MSGDGKTHLFQYHTGLRHQPGASYHWGLPVGQAGWISSAEKLTTSQNIPISGSSRPLQRAAIIRVTLARGTLKRLFLSSLSVESPRQTVYADVVESLVT